MMRLGLALRAHGADGGDRRPDEHDAGIGHRLREFGILRQEAVARMDGLGAGAVHGIDDGVDVEIAVLGRRRPDPHGLVGHGDVERAGIGIGVDRDGADAEPPRRAHDAAGDLAPIGDEELGEHR